MGTRVLILLMTSMLFVNVLFSQQEEDEKVVILPHRIAVKVLRDLETKDNLELRINLKDSIISVLEQRQIASDSLIATYKLNERDYKRIIKLNEDQISNLNEEIRIRDKKENEYKAQIRKLKFKNTITTIGSILLVGLLII